MQSIRVSRCVWVMVTALCAARAEGLLTEAARLTASDGAADDKLGSVAVDGDVVVVGVAGADVSGNANQGAAYVFIKTGPSWSGNLVQVAKLIALDGSANDQFGADVAIDGDTIVVGAPNDDNVEGADAGAAYVFSRPPAGWSDMTQTAKLISTATSASHHMGNGVAIEGTIVVAGTTSSNRIYTFARPDGGWTDMNFTAILSSSTAGNGEGLGTTVAISDDTIVAGAPSYSSGRGAVYVFERPGASWTANVGLQAAVLVASDATINPAFDNLGFGGISLDGDVVVAGVRNRSKGYVWVKPVDGWSATLSETASLTASDSAGNNAFGGDTAVYGDIIIVGASNTLVGPTAVGAAYRFDQPAGGWSGSLTETQRLNPSNDSGVLRLGSSVAVTPDTVFAAASESTVGGNTTQGLVMAFGEAPDPTATVTFTPTFTPTTTPTSTSTFTPTRTATRTASPSSTVTTTATRTSTPTATVTSSATTTPTATMTVTRTATATSTTTTTATSTFTASATATSTSTQTATASPTETTTPLPSATRTATQTATNTPTVSATPTSTTTPSVSPTRTATPTATVTATASASATPSSTRTPSNTPTVTPSATATSPNAGPAGPIDISYAYLTTGRVGHDIDNGRLRVIATIAGGDPFRAALLENPAGLRIHDASHSFDVTVPLTSCARRGLGARCRSSAGAPVRMIVSPDPLAAGSWRIRLYARKLRDLTTGPGGAADNPYAPPVTVELDIAGSTRLGTIESCKSVYHNTLVCRR